MMNIAQKSRITIHDRAIWCVGERREKGNVDEGKEKVNVRSKVVE